MTLMPVSNIWERGSNTSKAGAGRWISQRSSMLATSSVSSGRPDTLNTCPSTPAPTGTVIPRPVLVTTVPRRRPSVGWRQMHRTRPSPICWATSAMIVVVRPSSSTSKLTAWLISGRAPGGNSTSTTGPVMATMRPSASWCDSVVDSSTAVVMVLLWGWGAARLRRVGVLVGLEPHVLGAGAAQGLGAADDLHDLGGDRLLAGAVHDPGEGGDEVVGVVRGRLHGPLPGGVLRGRRRQEGGQHLALQPAGQEAAEQLAGLGLVLVVDDEALGSPGGVASVCPVLVLGALDGHERAGAHLLPAERLEVRVNEVDLVDVAGFVGLDDRGDDAAGILDARPVGHAGEGLADVLAPEAEVAADLAADGQEQHVVAVAAVVAEAALGGPEHRRVVGPGEAPVAGDGDDGRLRHRLGGAEERVVAGLRGAGQVGDDLGHLLDVGPRR